MNNGETSDRLTPVGKDIVRQMNIAMGRPFVKTGFPEAAFEEEHDGEASVGEIAVFNNYGTEYNPPRPFMEIAYDRNHQAMRSYIDSLISDVAQGKLMLKEALDKVGVRHQGQIRAAISSNIPPPNDPDTIVRKLQRGGFKVSTGSAPGARDAKNTTLIDTGQMRQAVDFETVMGKAPAKSPVEADNA